MRRRSTPRLWSVLALVLGSCAGNPRYDPWLVPRDSFLADTRVIALSPLRVPDDLEQPEPVEMLFDSLITSELRAAGFWVIPSDIVSEVWNDGADSIGGYYDPMTGLADTSKLNPLRRYYQRRLACRDGGGALAGRADGERRRRAGVQPPRRHRAVGEAERGRQSPELGAS